MKEVYRAADYGKKKAACLLPDMRFCVTLNGLAPYVDLAEYVSATRTLRDGLNHFVGWSFYKLQNGNNDTHAAGGIGLNKEAGKYYPLQHCRRPEPNCQCVVFTYQSCAALPDSDQPTVSYSGSP